MCCELLTNLVSLDSRNNRCRKIVQQQPVVNCLQILYLWIVETTIQSFEYNLFWL